MTSILCLYLALANICGFALMGSDKKRAREGRWRIPEARLFTVALCGGSAGSILGMYFFRHKTHKKLFAMGLPALLALQAVLCAALTVSDAGHSAVLEFLSMPR
ncbi:MAG: DUF1294 domain-containing protein [Desulfovibrionaceae bacterium]|nr:DUF1294 domain-containing protein [Desulfovibrionaceae bacterium]